MIPSNAISILDTSDKHERTKTPNNHGKKFDFSDQLNKSADLTTSLFHNVNVSFDTTGRGNQPFARTPNTKETIMKELFTGQA